jgi:hypothetical protein
MTPARHDAYRRVRGHLDGPGCYRLDQGERDLLLDVAEEMLLSRSGNAEDLVDTMERAAIALSTLTTAGRLDRALGVDLWQHICAAGPPAAGRTPVAVA